MTSLSFQTTVQKKEAKLSSFVQFENEMASYRALSHSHLQSYRVTSYCALFSDNTRHSQWEIIDTMF